MTRMGLGGLKNASEGVVEKNLYAKVLAPPLIFLFFLKKLWMNLSHVI